MTDDNNLPAPASILFRNDNRTVWLLDLPRSIEESQVASRETCLTSSHDDVLSERTTKRRRLRKRLISVPPLEKPFDTPEPRALDAPSTASPAAQINELMTLAAVENALQVLKDEYQGPCCLPRHLHREVDDGDKMVVDQIEGDKAATPGFEDITAAGQKTPSRLVATATSHSEPDDTKMHMDGIEGNAFIPPHTHVLNGSIASQLPTLLSPKFNHKFNLILLDPPWPNRSAARCRRGHDSSSSTSYSTASTPSTIRALLASIPIPQILAPGGTVAIWLTNSPALEDLLTNSKHGVLREWGLEIVDTWTWLKVTTSGEPIVALDSRTRRPWERLLFARRPMEEVQAEATKDNERGGKGKGRVIIAVPEAHSRKPNLRALLEEYLGLEATTADGGLGYAALEVFARNLTGGWWGWGDEVLRFQRGQFWCDDDECG